MKLKTTTFLFLLLAFLLMGFPFFVLAQTLDEDMAKAKAQVMAGEFKPAALAYKDILVKYKDLLRADGEKAGTVWEAFGDALNKAGWKDRAEGAFKRAEDAFKRAGKPRQILNGAMAGMAHPDEKTMNKYTMASLKNEKAQDHYRRGSAYFEDHHVLYAIMEFEKALEFEPENPELMDIAGRTMAEYGDVYFDKARGLMEKVRKSRGDPALQIPQWLALGRACAFAKKYDFKLAEEALSAAIKLNPKDFLANLYNGDLFLIQGEYKKSAEWFEKSLKVAAGDLRPLWGLGDSYTGLEDFKKALDFYSQAYELNQELPEAAFKFATGLKNVGRLDDSIHFHEVAIALDPSKAKYHLGLVAIYLPRIMDFSSKKHLDSALALEPENPWCHYYQGLYLEMRRRIDEAVAEYNLAAGYGPGMLDVKFQLANIFHAVGNSFPGNNFSCENPADRLEYLPYKDEKQAFRLYKEILAINPKYVQAAKINEYLAKLEEWADTEKRLKERIDKAVR
ncbi:hypothetical protein AUK22_10190 [bacterium CG2_30_54_10]|nr:MAG: hypothetical protein AUK22_10190 [bacterium CG2_30_54_10]